MDNRKKILVVTPSFYSPGAEQLDRLGGFSQLTRLGYEVKVIAKLAEWHSTEFFSMTARDLGIQVIPISYKYSKRNLFSEILHPLLLDGAAFEYNDPEIKKTFEKEINNWRPNFVFFDCTYLWPLYDIARKAGIPVIARSINFEPRHFLQEEGYAPTNCIKALLKLAGEYVAVRKSDWLFAITPDEEQMYRRLGARRISALPLRGLPDCIRSEHQIRARRPLNVFFFGSTYNFSHNRRALEFVLKEIAQSVRTARNGEFIFHISGRKLPEEYKKYFADDVIYHGYLDYGALDKLLLDMDIALIPSFFGAGMQQKIFEPLCRGIPTITSERGIAGYPFRHKENVYLAKTTEDFISGLLELRDVSLRKKLSQESIKTAQKIFSQTALDSIVQSAIDTLKSN